MSEVTLKSKPLVVIDASGWLFRAYHALPPLSNMRGEPTGAKAGARAFRLHRR